MFSESLIGPKESVSKTKVKALIRREPGDYLIQFMVFILISFKKLLYLTNISVLLLNQDKWVKFLKSGKDSLTLKGDYSYSKDLLRGWVFICVWCCALSTDIVILEVNVDFIL